MSLASVLPGSASSTAHDPLSRALSIAALIVSFLALVGAGITLWRTHFAKMSLVLAAGPATFRIAHFEADDEQWFVPALDTRIVFANTGARAGRVLALRIRVDYPQLPIPNAHEFFELNAEVDSAIFAEHASNRLEWRDRAVIGEGAPMVCLPKVSIEKHLVFDGHWLDRVIQKLTFTLQMCTDEAKRRWVNVESWDLDLDPYIWKHTVEASAAFSMWPTKHPTNEAGRETFPPDLHKYTGVKAPPPDDDVFRHTSTLRNPAKDRTDS